MRIAFFSDTFFPAVNGVVTSMMNLSVGLSALGHEVLIVVPDSPGLEMEKLELPPKVRILLQPSLNGRLYPNLRVGLPTVKLYGEVKKFNPDVIHSLTPLMLGLEAIVLAKRLRKPLLHTYGTNADDEKLLKAVKLFRVKLLRDLQRKGVGGLAKQFLQLHDRVVVSTRETQGRLVKFGVLKPIDVVPLPVPISKLEKGRNEGLSLKNKLGISQAVIYVGRLSQEKSLDKLIKVFSNLSAKFPKLKLVLVGDGPAREELFLMAAEMGISERIVWVGEVSHKDLIEKGYYYLGDVFVSFSDFDTQGMSTVEAMACGLVVVGVRDTAIAEVIGENGLVVDGGNMKLAARQIGEVFKESKLREFSKRARARARDYSIDICSRKLVRVYDQVVGK